MIRWCAFCQSFAGEKKPYDNFDFTDGICEKCSSENHSEQDHRIKQDRFVQAQALFQGMRDRAHEGVRIQPKEIVSEARAIKIAPVDLLLGMIQPLLREIGDLFVKGQITVTDEHRFSRFTEELLSAISYEYDLVEPEQCDVMLASADGNYHTLGTKMLSLVLNQNGIPTMCFTPSMPEADLVKLVSWHQPSVLGISVSKAEQLNFIHRVEDSIKSLPSLRVPQILVGGVFAKDNDFTCPWPSPNPRSLSEFVTEFKKHILPKAA